MKKIIISIAVFFLLFLTKSISETLNCESDTFKSAVIYGISSVLYWEPYFNRTLEGDKLSKTVLANMGKVVEAKISTEKDQDDPKISYYIVSIPSLSATFPKSSKYMMRLRYSWNGKSLLFLGATTDESENIDKIIKIKTPVNWAAIAGEFSGEEKGKLILGIKDGIKDLFEKDGMSVSGQHFFVGPFNKEFSVNLVFYWVEGKKIIQSEIKSDLETGKSIFLEPMATKTIDLGERDPDEKLGKSIEYNKYLSYLLIHCVKDGVLVEFSK